MLSSALPIPVELSTYLEWSQTAIDERLNGLLINWYDGRKNHYIGKHRDNVKGLVTGAPIITISFGEGRTFRLREWKGKERVDVVLEQGSVVVLPYETNLAWTHEITKSKRARGRRISITIRVFE